MLTELVEHAAPSTDKFKTPLVFTRFSISEDAEANLDFSF